MRIILTGGGTGGHLYPALAVAEEIRRRKPDSEFLYLGSKDRIEASAVPSAGFNIEFIRGAGLSGNPVKLARFFMENFIGIGKSLGIMKKFRPDFVIGSGGFVSAPPLFSARLLKIPYFILEQNVLPGKVNRALAGGAKKIFLSFEKSTQYFKGLPAVVSGNPVRQEILEGDRFRGAEKLGLDPQKFTILATGGSQGAKAINEALVYALRKWKDKPWQIIHLTGQKNFAGFSPLIKEFENCILKYLPLPYSEDMAYLYASSDLILARSGASTLAEITALGLPAILAPFPFSADNHQEKNARWVEEMGGAIVINDGDLERDLLPAVESLEGDRKRLREMSGNIKKLGKPRALPAIVDEILESF